MGIEATGSPGSLQSFVSQSANEAEGRGATERNTQERTEQNGNAPTAQRQERQQAEQTQEQELQTRQTERSERQEVTAASQETARLESQNNQAASTPPSEGQGNNPGQRVGSIINTQV